MHHTFQPGDCVLVGLGTSPAVGLHARYVPGIVEAVCPRDTAVSQQSAVCRVNTFGCHDAVTRTKEQLVKIPHSCYVEACRSMTEGMGRRAQDGAQNGGGWRGDRLQGCCRNVADKGKLEVGINWSCRLGHYDLCTKEAFSTSEVGAVEGHCKQKESKMELQHDPEDQDKKQNETEFSKQDTSGMIGNGCKLVTAVNLHDKLLGAYDVARVEVDAMTKGNALTLLKGTLRGQKVQEEEPREVQEEPRKVQEEEPREVQEEEPRKVQEEEPRKVQEEEPRKVQEEEPIKVLEEEPIKVLEGAQNVKLSSGNIPDNAALDEVWNSLPYSVHQPTVVLKAATSIHSHPRPIEVWTGVSSLEKQLGEGMRSLGGHLEQLGSQISTLLSRQGETLVKAMSLPEGHKHWMVWGGDKLHLVVVFMANLLTCAYSCVHEFSLLTAFTPPPSPSLPSSPSQGAST